VGVAKAIAVAHWKHDDPRRDRLHEIR